MADQTPISRDVTHFDLAVTLAKLEGSVNTIAILLDERNKHYQSLERDHNILSVAVQSLKERQAQINILGLVAVFVIPLLVTIFAIKIPLTTAIDKRVDADIARPH